MSRLQAALQLKDDLSRCKHESGGLWNDTRQAFEVIIGEYQSLRSMYHCKETWMDRGGRLEQILRFLVLFGSPPAWFTSFPERQIFLGWVRSAINCCCVALERIDLIDVDWFTLRECAVFIGLFGRCPRPIYIATLEQLILYITSARLDSVSLSAEMQLGFMMIFDEQRFDRALKQVSHRVLTINIDVNSKIRRWINVSIAKNVTGQWVNFGCDLMKNFIKFHSEMYVGSMFSYEYLLSRYALMQPVQDIARRDFLLSRLLESILHAPSLSFISSGLRNLSEFCEQNGEYHLPLKALKNARRICFMKNGEHIAPSFVKSECSKMKRILEAKIKGMRCGYCARIGNSDLLPCTGCMKLAYCDKRCQKKHWNREHRDSCARTWRAYYHDIQSCLRRMFGD